MEICGSRHLPIGTFAFRSPTLPVVSLFGSMLLLSSPASALSTGQPVPSNEFLAVGTVNQCTATLISAHLVLTAAHCICTATPPASCFFRADFELGGSSHAGDVRRHPDHQFLHNEASNSLDLAVIELDNALQSAAPIPIAGYLPASNDFLTLVGYGDTGPNCSQANPPPGQAPVKMKFDLPVNTVEEWGMEFHNSQSYACGGDSGGPVIDNTGQIVGVMTDAGVIGVTLALPTYPFAEWIENSPAYSGYGACHVVSVGAQQSLSPTDPWCPKGTFLTRFDLDADASVGAHSSPIIGQAHCCAVKGFGNYGDSVDNYETSHCQGEPGIGEEAALIGHQPTPAWCSHENSYLTGVDLVGDSRFDARDSPVVERVHCCHLGRNFRAPAAEVAVDADANRCEWVPIGVERSHAPLNDLPHWCRDGQFIRQFDLDQFESDWAPGPYDAPIVGKALCCR